VQPRLIVVAGPNGSGKTTITDQLLRHIWMHGCVYINPDMIAQEQFGNWNDPAAIKQAAALATERREQALIDGVDIAFETVFSAPDKLDYVRRARSAGYFVRLFL
jgi:predicted ABC-type ATPase